MFSSIFYAKNIKFELFWDSNYFFHQMNLDGGLSAKLTNEAPNAQIHYRTESDLDGSLSVDSGEGS